MFKVELRWSQTFWRGKVRDGHGRFAHYRGRQQPHIPNDLSFPMNSYSFRVRIPFLCHSSVRNGSDWAAIRVTQIFPDCILWFLVFDLLVFMSIRQSVAAQTGPPVAKKIPKEIVTHGDKRVDDYFWLREKTNSEVLAYLQQENSYAEEMSKPQERLRQELYDEILGHLKETDSTAPVRRGDYSYYSRTEQGKNYPIHCRKRNQAGAVEEIILDVNELAKDFKFFSIGAFAPSDDNNLLAYTADTTGYRQFTLRIKDLRTGKLLPEKFERVDDVVWATDNKTLYFVTENEVTKRQDEFHRHVLGSSGAERLYFEPDELYDISASRSRDRAYIFVHAESKRSTDVRALPADGSATALRVLNPREPEHKYYAEHHHGKFFFRTNDKAKNYKIVTAPDNKPAKQNWTEFQPHSPAVKIEDIDLFAHHCVVSERENGLERLRIIELENKQAHVLDLPDPAYELSVDANPEFDTAVLRFRYQSLVRPLSYFDYNMNSKERTLVKAVEVPAYDPNYYASERVFATASDGVKIPCSMVYKKGLTKNGRNPLLLYGYGSYGVSMPDTFSFPRLALLDRDFVFVIAHIRGGGEMGEEWRDQGRMMSKKKTFTDFIDCARFLIEQKYTSPDRIAIQGGSAGGLLMGAVVNMQPGLFRAAIAQVPFVDVLNTMLDASLPLTTSEYIEWGNPNEKPAYDYMKTYSPYDNVKKQAYPAMLIRVSLNDSQVPYWEGAKFAAKIRSLKTDKNLLLLKTNMGAGHGGASGRYDYLKDIAFDYSFLLGQLGASEKKTPDLPE